MPHPSLKNAQTKSNSSFPTECPLLILSNFSIPPVSWDFWYSYPPLKGRRCSNYAFSSIFRRYYSLTHTVLSRILLGFFSSKACVLFLFQASFEKFESGTKWADPYCPFRKTWSTFIKNTYGSLLYFSNISSKFWQRANTAWPILSFQGSNTSLFEGSNTNFHLTSYISWCSQTFNKKPIKNCLWDNVVWLILSFQGLYSYTNFLQKLFFFFFFFFWCSKIYSKDFIKHNMVWLILSFQWSYLNSYTILHIGPPNTSIFFGVKNSLKNCIRHSKFWPLFSFSGILSSFH